MAWRFFWSLKYGGRYSLFVKTYTLQGTITYPVFNALLSRWVSFSQGGTCSLEGNWYTGIKNYIIHMVDRRKIGLSHCRGMIFPVFFAGKLSKRPLRQKGRVIWRKHVLCFFKCFGWTPGFYGLSVSMIFCGGSIWKPGIQILSSNTMLLGQQKLVDFWVHIAISSQWWRKLFHAQTLNVYGITYMYPKKLPNM